MLLDLLRAEGVDTLGVLTAAEHQTSSSVIPVRPNGDRPAWHCIGANGALSLDNLPPLAFLDDFDFVHLGGPEFFGGEAAATLLARAREHGAVTSLDVLAPGDPDLLAWIADALPHADYLLPNDEQVLGFTGATDLAEGARALVAAGVGCVAVTQGAQGALVVTADDVVEVPAYPVRGGRHDRLRRRVLRWFPAGPVARSQSRRRGHTRLCDRGPGRPRTGHRCRLLHVGERHYARAMSSDITVTRNDERARFEASIDGEVAGYSEFKLGEGRIEFTHTVVDDAFEGKGVGSTLVSQALDQARAEGLDVVATCAFVRSYIERHQEYADLLAS